MEIIMNLISFYIINYVTISNNYVKLKNNLTYEI